MITRAPGVVKLFGEHAVVHGRTAVAAAVSVFATVELEPNGGDELSIWLEDFGGKAISMDQRALKAAYEKYASRKSIDEYISEMSAYDKLFLPYITIAARLHSAFGASPLGNKIRISSSIPMQKGLASSAACSTAFTIAILSNSGTSLPDDSVIDVARDGERVVHKNDNAGRIDVPTSFYGGLVKVSSSEITPIKAKNSIKLMLIDTGPKKSTAETVGNVTRLYTSNRAYAESLFDQIDECSQKGIEALLNSDTKTAGMYMYTNQKLLEKLGVSSDSIETAVRISKDTGMLGAKLSGGGGGGIAVAIPGDGQASAAFYDRLKEAGFSIIEANIYHAESHY
ncbi:MAG: mevalonate kinase [Candidatus Marsarchaeota archaeon]|nr:mevalonate kinase [Candidatus Marsarchaeota archaeon]